MKLFKLLRLLCLLIIFSVSTTTLSSCGDDDDDDNEPSPTIDPIDYQFIGVWQITSYTCSTANLMPANTEKWLWEFKNDETFVDNKDGVIQSGKYTVSGNQITIPVFDAISTQTEFVLTIKTCTQNSLVLERTANNLTYIYNLQPYTE